jgi:hypothetical protein
VDKAANFRFIQNCAPVSRAERTAAHRNSFIKRLCRSRIRQELPLCCRFGSKHSAQYLGLVTVAHSQFMQMDFGFEGHRMCVSCTFRQGTCFGASSCPSFPARLRESLIDRCSGEHEKGKDISTVSGRIGGTLFRFK